MKKLLLLLVCTHIAYPMTDILESGCKTLTQIATNPKVTSAFFSGSLQGITTFIKIKNPDLYNKWGMYTLEAANDIIQNPQTGMLNNIPIFTKKILSQFIEKIDTPDLDNSPKEYVKENFTSFYNGYENKDSLQAGLYTMRQGTKTLLFLPNTFIKYIGHHIKTPFAKRFASESPDAVINDAGNLFYLITLYFSMHLARTEWLEFLRSHSKYIDTFMNIFSTKNILKQVFINKENISFKHMLINEE